MGELAPPDPPPAIIVTGQALPSPLSSRALGQVVLDQRALANSPSGRLEEVLRQVPGVQLFRRSDSRSSHPTSQGVSLRALGGNASSRALLILDGVPQSDPFGGWVTWPAFDPAALASVRITRGGGSVAHGPGALAGIIAMDSDDRERLAGEFALGSRDSIEARAAAARTFGGAGFRLSAHHSRGDGFVPITVDTRGPADRSASWRQSSLRGTASTDLGEIVSARLSGALFRDRRSRGLAFTDNRTDGADLSLRLVGKGTLPWTALAYGQWREFESSFASTDADRTEARQVADQFSVPSSGFGGSAELRPDIGSGFELRLGGDGRIVDGRSLERYFFIGGEPTRGRRSGGSTATLGGFAELSASFGSATLTGAARIDRWWIGSGFLRERVLATGSLLRDESSSSRRGWLPTGRLGAAIAVDPRWSLRSAAYLGWRMPTLNELFRPFRVGADATAANPGLDPERLAGLEAGLDYRRGGAALSATVFANRLNDGIANVSLARGPGVFPGVGFVAAGGEYQQRRNLDAVEVVGMELSGQLQLGPWRLEGGASLTRARVRADDEAALLNGLRPAQTPALSWTGSAGWAKDGRRLLIEIRHVGAQFEDDLNRQKLPSATTLGASAALPLGDRLQLVARGENLTNERVVARIDSDGAIERATPRTLWIGLRFGAD